MSFNPYSPGTPETLSEIGDAKTPRSGTLDSCWRGARKGARIAGYVGAAVSLFLIVPALALTAFALGAGRGFGLSIYLLVGLGICVFFGVLGVASCINYFIEGLFSRESLALAVLLAIPYTMLFLLGAIWFDRASDGTYRRIAYAMIGIAGLVSLPIFDRFFQP